MPVGIRISAGIRMPVGIRISAGIRRMPVGIRMPAGNRIPADIRLISGYPYPPESGWGGGLADGYPYPYPSVYPDFRIRLRALNSTHQHKK